MRLTLLLSLLATAAVRGDYLQTNVYASSFCTSYYIQGSGGGYGTTATSTPSAAPSNFASAGSKPVLSSVWTFGCTRWTYRNGAVLWYGSQQYRCFNASHIVLYRWSGAANAPDDQGASCGGGSYNVSAPLQAAPMPGQPLVTVVSGSACMLVPAGGQAGSPYSFNAKCIASGSYLATGTAARANIYEYAPVSPPPPSSTGTGSVCASSPTSGDVYTLDFMQAQPGNCYPLPRTRAPSATFYYPPVVTSTWYDCAASMTLYIDNSTTACTPAASNAILTASSISTGGVCVANPSGADVLPAVGGYAVTNATQAQFASLTCPFAGFLTPTPASSASPTSSPFPAPSFVYAMPVTVSFPSTFAPSYSDSSIQLTLRVAIAALTSVGVSDVQIAGVTGSSAGGVSTYVYTVEVVASPALGPAVAASLATVSSPALISVAIALSAATAGALDMSAISVAPAPAAMTVTCLTAFSSGPCSAPAPFSTSPTVAPSLVPPTPASTTGAVAFGVAGGLVAVAILGAAFAIHRAGRLSKLALAAQSAQASTLMLGNLGGSVPIAPPATFSFGGGVGGGGSANPLASRRAMSVRPVKVVTEDG